MDTFRSASTTTTHYGKHNGKHYGKHYGTNVSLTKAGQHYPLIARDTFFSLASVAADGGMAIPFWRFSKNSVIPSKTEPLAIDSGPAGVVVLLLVDEPLCPLVLPLCLQKYKTREGSGWVRNIR